MNECPNCRGSKIPGAIRTRANSKHVQVTACSYCDVFVDDESAAIYVSAMDDLPYEKHPSGHYVVDKGDAWAQAVQEQIQPPSQWQWTSTATPYIYNN